jgi:hypothetical protein
LFVFIIVIKWIGIRVLRGGRKIILGWIDAQELSAAGATTTAGAHVGSGRHSRITRC